MIEGSHTLRNERRDFVEWHRGRKPYVFWALDIETEAVRQKLAAAARHLDGLLLDGYARQPHITLEICGFAGQEPTAADEFGPDHLQAQIEALRQAAPPPFDIEIGELDSFNSAPYLALNKGSEAIAEIRRCLARGGAMRLYGDYVSHVTVGLYADAWLADEVNALLAAFPASVALWQRIESVSLMGYDPSEIGGALRRLGAFQLDSRDMVWHEWNRVTP